jgi:competence protein ComEA
VQLSRRHMYAYAALALVVLAVGLRYLVPHGAAAGSTPVSLLASASAASVSPSPSPPASTVIVYVCGAVRRPGVLTLPTGARVADALAMAGGALPRAELAAINLAARLSDGQQVVVPIRGQVVAAAPGAAGAAGGPTPAAIVNLNTATAAELDALQGVGPSTAQKIIDYRTANGGFKSIEELKNVAGIGDAKFAAIKDHVTV